MTHIAFSYNDPQLNDISQIKQKLGIDPQQKCVWATDFDGVLIDGIENYVFHLSSFSDEAEKLIKVAEKVSNNEVSTDINSAVFLRHIVLQHLMKELGDKSEPGPFLKAIQSAQKAGEIFILHTARASYPGVVRAHEFLQAHALVPERTYHVGITPKTPQLQLLAQHYPNLPIIFTDDSSKHIESAKNLNHPSIHTIHIDWNNCPITDEQIMNAYQDILDRYQAA